MIKTRTFPLLFLLMLVPGIAMLIGSIYILKDNIQFVSNSLKAEGRVVEILSESSDNRKFYFAPRVSFFDSVGKEIIFDSKQYSNSNNRSTYEIGEIVSVYYDKNDSKIAKINSFSELWLWFTVLIILGLIFTIIGWAAFKDAVILPIQNRLLKQNLIRNGSKIVAKVQSVHRGDGFSDKYVISAQWVNPKDNKVYVFKSENLVYNPTGMIKNNEISVYIDPEMPQKYYVDVSVLPEVVN